jgi:hypothetical protein
MAWRGSVAAGGAGAAERTHAAHWRTDGGRRLTDITIPPPNREDETQREVTMHSHDHHLLHRLLVIAGALVATAPGLAADVTPERLANPEPSNWLMNHRTYDSQRYSPLDKINTSNIKSLRLAYAVAIGGTSANENLE